MCVFLFFDSIIHKSCKKESDRITEKTFARKNVFVCWDTYTICCGETPGWVGGYDGNSDDWMNNKMLNLAKNGGMRGLTEGESGKTGEKMQERAKVFLEFWGKGW